MTRIRLAVSLLLLSASMSIWAGCSGPDDSPTPSGTDTPEVSQTPILTPTPTGTPVNTPTPTHPVGTPTPTATPGTTPTNTPGTTPTNTPGTTPTPTGTPGVTPTPTPGVTPTPTPGVTPTPTVAPTPTAPPDVDNDGYSPSDGDCNDNDPAIYPGAPEIVDGKDNNCDGKIDDKPDPIDNDNDGFSEAQGDCNDTDKTIYPGSTEIPYDGIDQDCSGADLIDLDGDGYGSVETGNPADLDCDDNNIDVNPDAVEVCNAVDDNCNDQIDENLGTTYYKDADGDTYGNASNSVTTCTPPGAGYVLNKTDCNDNAAAVNPGAQEVCNSIDDDCDSQIDDADSSTTGKSTWYKDADTDGYGTSTTSTQACTQPTGYVTSSTDCNDSDKAVNPGAQEVCNLKDDDCDTQLDDADSSIAGQSTWYKDNDTDGYGDAGSSTKACTQPTGYVTSATDCNDTDKAINPGAQEVCNSKDDDCDNLVDDADSSVTGKSTWYKDADTDGYGTSTSSVQACTQPTGYVSNATDCNDADKAINPLAQEVCDSKDNDCDNLTDDADPSTTGKTTWYKDADADGYGASSTTTQACTKPTGYVTSSTDCNDGDNKINPGAQEICNSKDDDCDNLIDDADSSVTGKTTWYKDADADGYGLASTTVTACAQPTGYASQSGDCNDTDKTIYPTAPEQCNGKDDNCNGTIDDNVTQVTWYKDNDGDGYGNPAVTTTACSQPTGYVSNKTDCNDSSAAINPAASEVCDSVDNDCDTLIDDLDPSVSGRSTFYQDVDADGYGASAVSTQACTKPTGYVTNSTDCNDSDKNVNPGAQEVCNGKDDDCDTKIDDADTSTTGKPTWYKDTDADGYGTSTTTLTQCSQPTGYVSTSGDCNDADATIKPGATEQCNGKDDNCNGTIDDGVTTSTWYKDNDTDGYGTPSTTVQACSQPTGYVSNSTDCNDADKNINPAATEICDTKDNDCDGKIDDADSPVSGRSTFYRDADGDTYGSSSVTTQACVQPTGYVTSSTDCNDSSAAINPGATEVCDQVDNNCNGSTDEGLATTTYYKDTDNDGFGSSSQTQQACAKPTGYATVSGDCNDTNPSINPNANETCNGSDDNCNGTTDEEAAATCPGTDGVCQVKNCTGGTCGFAFKPAGTEVTNTTPGDCKSEQCDGAGAVVSAPKDSDKPNDNNSCTTDSCSSGSPAYSNVTEGSACTDNGGTTCDGAGTCTLSFVVLQVGDGTNALASTTTLVNLEERFINGNKVNRTGNPLAVPTAVSGSNQALTLGGTATSEGSLTRSEDTHYLVFGGYNAATGATAGSSTVSRVIGRLDNTGTLDTSTQITPAFNAATMRGAAAANGQGMWASASTGGVQYVAFGSTGASTQVLAAPANMRWVQPIAGQLYGSSGSGTYVNIFTIGTGEPTTTGATATSFAGMPTTTGPSPYGFMLFDLNPNVAGVDTLYVADDTNPSTSVGGIQKWTYNGTTWTKITTFKNGLGTIGVRGLTGTVMSGKVYLMATTADASSASNKVVLFVDDGVALDPAATVIATSPAKTQYRGIALPPR